MVKGTMLCSRVCLVFNAELFDIMFCRSCSPFPPVAALVCCKWSDGLRSSGEGQMRWRNPAQKAYTSFSRASVSLLLPPFSTCIHPM